MPLDSSALIRDTGESNGLFDAIVSRLPDATRATLSEAQLEALRESAESIRWGKHPIDIRLSIPTFLSRYYLVLVGGKERRGKDRLAEERKRHPLNTLFNWLFIGGVIALGVYVVVFLEMLFFISHFSDYFG